MSITKMNRNQLDAHIMYIVKYGDSAMIDDLDFALRLRKRKGWFKE